ncbi:MAG TPA: lipase family protein [Acidimicrobiales bacterium]|nr:lipase family protein [Acidimicrobiales bacterium]
MLLGLVLAASACSPASSSPPPSAPHGLPAFYVVPSGVGAKAPGTLLKYEKTSVAGVHATAYRVMYVSTGIGGKNVAVTGMVFVPPTAAPTSGRDVVTWSHGTNGMGDICAPSTNYTDEDLTTIPPASLNALLAQGWVVTASDYQGEGTPPDLLPYLVGDISGDNTIDIVLAAHQLRAADTSKHYVVWGHSEGGQTAMFAWEAGETYGARQGFTMLGAVAGAPPTQFAAIYAFLETSPYRFYLYMATVGYNVAYGNAAVPLRQILTAKAISLLPALQKGCFDYLENTLDKYTYSQLIKENPTQMASFAPILSENDPGLFSNVPSVPLLIIQGGADEQIPVVTTQILYTHLCGLGANVERWIYPGLDHFGVIAVSTKDMVGWIAQRFAGAGVSPAPVGVAGVQTESCGTPTTGSPAG